MNLYIYVYILVKNNFYYIYLHVWISVPRNSLLNSLKCFSQYFFGHLVNGYAVHKMYILTFDYFSIEKRN